VESSNSGGHGDEAQRRGRRRRASFDILNAFDAPRPTINYLRRAPRFCRKSGGVRADRTGWLNRPRRTEPPEIGRAAASICRPSAQFDPYDRETTDITNLDAHRLRRTKASRSPIHRATSSLGASLPLGPGSATPASPTRKTESLHLIPLALHAHPLCDNQHKLNE